MDIDGVFTELGFPSVDLLEPCYSCQERCARVARLFLEFEAAVSRGLEIITRNPDLTLMDSQWLRDVIKDITETRKGCNRYGRRLCQV
jgi:hypothetical protein